MTTENILTKAFAELRAFPAVAEEFFQEAVGAKDRADFLRIVREYAPNALEN